MVKTINGFDLESISDTVNELKHNPSKARYTFRTKNDWIKAGHNRSYIKEFYGGGKEDESRNKHFIFDNGEPPILLGNNEGANPMEFVLHALAGCMTTTMVLYAATNGISVEKISSKIEGDLDLQGFLGLDPTVRNGYQNISVSFEVEGDIDGEDRTRLTDFCLKSPVFDIIANSVPIALKLEEASTKG
ncbi:MAG: OsmC family protein [Bacteroidota bacterium]